MQGTNAAIRETIDVAEKYGLSVERLHDGSHYKLLISKKRCQLVRCRAIPVTLDGKFQTFIALFAPKSAWAEYLILFVTPASNAESSRFYILPSSVKRRAMLSTSGWVREYANSWHLLSDAVGTVPLEAMGQRDSGGSQHSKPEDK